MKKLQLVLIIGLLVAVGSAWRQLNEIQANSPLARSVKIASTTSETLKDSATAAGAAAAPENFAALFKEETTMISQPNDNPEEVQKRLDHLAGKMQESDVKVLQENALNPKINGDQRFLSVYILGKSHLQKAQESLEAIASAPFPEIREARMTVQEEIIRGQAVESIRQVDMIKRVLSRSDNNFINDRAQRNLMFLEGKASSPEQQDQSALTQLLKKKNQ